MPRFVRCIEGHVFDAESSPRCPTCGAIVEVPAAAPIDMPAALDGDIGQAGFSTKSSSAGIAAARMPLFASAAVVILGVGIGALVFALHESKTKSGVSGNSASSASQAAKNGAETNASAAPLAPAAPQNNNAVTAPSAPSESQASSNSLPAPSVKVSDTLKTTLDVVRMLADFGKSNYADAVSLSDKLTNENNPIAMFIKAGLLMDGLGGQPRDLTQARNLLAKATQLGDPTSALFYGRVLENGIGGPRDPNGAKDAYLFSARSMAPGADQDLARLRLGDSRGMTALQAYQSLLNGTSLDGLNVINELTQRYSTPAECLYGWLLFHSKAKGWVLAHTHDQGHAFVVQSGDMAASQAATQEISDDEIKQQELGKFEYGAVRSDPWCEWGMAMLAKTGAPGYPKNLVEADVFYRLVAMHKTLGSDIAEAKKELAAVQSQITPDEKASADDLFHGAVPPGMTP
jgi:TPR repeat protein